ncbi:ABC transporter substrate-binding protein [Spongiibacter nanhainus]|uniref:ABC transporter substrate-binding protein n=1 Tax=Spongiibacter nanhainus TaxID=2794344 RepID=A0A7T4R270_9GAMM|nr:ABC transporter substrate-binding protein [Spongiibacter nanhainus]QQD19045.1 ABC transporter substrate-binding protein [Spongiibacter nanhainus]
MIKRILLAATMMVLGLSLSAQAEDVDKKPGPYEVVAGTTEELVKEIEAAREYYDEDPERFNQRVREMLDEVVDFQSFARGVMGRYGSRAYYQSLQSEEAKARFRDRVIRFTESFKDGLINTYAKGLLAFNGNRIEVLPLAEDADLSGSVGVRQHIYGDRPKPYEVVYTLRKDSNGEWKLRNVIIEGLNLGRIYQNQFNAAVRTHDGDIDKVIDNWTVAPQEVMEQQAEG